MDGPLDPPAIRLQSVAGILARGIARLREPVHDSVEPSAESERVFGNLADCLPEPLDGLARPLLTVTDVSETAGFETNRDQKHSEVKHGE